MNVICKEAAADFDVALIYGLGQDRKQAENELLNSGVCLPLPQRAIWAENINHTDSLFLLIRKPNGAACGGLGFEQIFPRSMPGHSMLQVRMFGGNLPSDCRTVALEALRTVASTMKRVLRLKVNVFSRTDHEGIAQTMRDLGYCELQTRSRYRHTLAIVRAILGLASGLDMKVVAEGIETQSDLACLAAEGCKEGQGYFFSEARPQAEIIKLLSEKLPRLRVA